MKTFILIILLSFSACSVKEYKLFQKENPDHIQTIQNISYDSKIMVDDILVIDIYNMNQKATIDFFNPNKESSSNEYIVSEEGEVFIPLLGEIKVEGLTLPELNNLLSQKYKKYLNKPYVKSKIKNHKVYVLGEVSSEGIVPIEGNNISIIEVIAKSGGFSDHALRDRIRIIFEEQGEFKIRTLDLTKFSTLNTYSLMVKHNSIVYVEPKSTKAVKVAIEDYSPILKAVSTVLGAFLTIDYLKGN